MKIGKKQMLKFLRKQVALLPPQTYKAFHRYFKPTTSKNDEGKMILVGGEMEEHPVNHKRRAWGMYKRYGWWGVEHYFAMNGFKIIED